jgi:adenylate kinase family enzyme
MTIIHICGFSGSGKTTLGNELKSKYKDKIIVQDLDEYLPDGDSDQTAYEIKNNMIVSINNFLKSTQSNLIVLIGTTCNTPTLNEFTFINADHHIWLDVSIEESSTRAIRRQIDWMYKNEDDVIDMMKEMTYDETSEYLNTYCNYQSRIKKWSPLYEICINTFKFDKMSYEQIFKYINNMA